MKKSILFVAACTLLLAACGKKGPLVLEPQKLPPAAEHPALRQVGSQVELSWRFPARFSDQKTPLQTSLVRYVTVYHLAKPFAPETFLKKSEVLAKPKAGELINRGNGTFACLLPFKEKMLKDREHAFALVYYYGRTASALSAVVRITTRIPPQPVRDLKIGREGKVVVLNWSRPEADSEGNKLPALAGYRVYRRIITGKAAGDFAAISGKPVKGEYYQDRDTGADGEYEYQVAAILSEQIESSPSTPVRMMIQDTFPPDVPANLVTFTARVTDNFYHDRQVVKGQLFQYMVSAVDRKGNESEPCKAVSQLFE
jgi:predicted small lipoprotein YifL